MRGIERIVRKVAVWAKNKVNNNKTKRDVASYLKRFIRYSYVDGKCETEEQFEASITRLYHTIEKGLAYENYRAGFGKDNVDMLITTLTQYKEKGFDTRKFCYSTALSCLNIYVSKNREYGVKNESLEKGIQSLAGTPNSCGGTRMVSRPQGLDRMNYEELVKLRHSIRHFSTIPVELELLKKAIRLAQYTPSACNRQGWKTRIIADKRRILKVLDNQNGNTGFGHEIDKLLVVTADLRTEQRDRELFQAFIDGGMYAESIINSLFYYGIGSVPLSASLTPIQEHVIREEIGIDDAEVLILFIGVGNYPEGDFLTTQSERKKIDVEVM